ncbi:MAG: hypothetical protein DRQ46_09945 [Gammaproteobacteria bacterium]|nr:MAG: hypothetical protein DRQ46_09945 [Gammaproteobacteria bacterium]
MLRHWLKMRAYVDGVKAYLGSFVVSFITVVTVILPMLFICGRNNNKNILKLSLRITAVWHSDCFSSW